MKLVFSTTCMKKCAKFSHHTMTQWREDVLCASNNFAKRASPKNRVSQTELTWSESTNASTDSTSSASIGTGLWKERKKRTHMAT